MFTFFSRGVGLFFGSRSSGAVFTPPPSSSGEWLLATGYWDDSGVWDDTAIWEEN